VARQSAEAGTVDQCIYRVQKDAKRDLLIHLIDDGQWHQVLVFTRTKHGANRLAEQLLRAGINAAAIHGNKSQSARTKALADFKGGSVRALVATDIAARGLDIDCLPHVVNYELPDVPEHYVHRIGRTGRAGNEGTAVSLVSGEEVKLLEDVRRLLKKDIPVLPMPQFKPKVLQQKPEHKSQAQGKSETRRKPRAGGAGRSGQPSHGGGSHTSTTVSPGQKRKRRSRNSSRQPARNSR
jgi:ATP-dependent RNA helicase RhlE